MNYYSCKNFSCKSDDAKDVSDTFNGINNIPIRYLPAQS